MKLIHATSILLATGGASAVVEKSSSSHKHHKKLQSLAGVRVLQKLASRSSTKRKQRDLQLFGSLGAAFDTTTTCGDSCTDNEVCSSFMGLRVDLEATCDSGCIPEYALNSCEEFCSDDGTIGANADADAVVTAEKRLGLFGGSMSASDLLCGNCKFYRCCVEDASYDTCESKLPDMNSLLFPDNNDNTDMDMDGSEGLGFGMMEDWDMGMGDWGLGDSGFGELVDSIVPDDWGMDWGGDSDGSSGDNSATSTATVTGTESASGMSVLGDLLTNLDCPKTCDDGDLCNSFFLGMGDEAVISKACNSGCLPSMPSCDDICENSDGAEFAGSIVGMACDSCKFLECCAGDEEFATCKGNLPEMGNLLIDWDTSTTYGSDWSGNSLSFDLDWSGMEEALGGLSELVEGLHSLFDEALVDFDSFPVTCNPETCPIDGACDMTNVLLADVNFENVCTSNAFFDCMEGLEDMCANECDEGSNNLGAAAFCSLCDIATCCSVNGSTASFEDCAMESIPQSFTDAMEDITDVFDQLPSILENLAGFLEEVVGDISVPEFCPEVDGAVACPVEGFCEIFDGDFSNFDMDDACESNAFFRCGPEDFDSMCTEQCGSGSDADVTIVAEQRLADNARFDAAFCSLCSVARCCRDKDANTSFLEACALDSLPEQFAIANSGGTSSTPVEDLTEASPSDSGAEENENPGGASAEASQEEFSSESNAVAGALSGSSVEGSNIPEGTSVEDSPSEPAVEETNSLSDTPGDDSASGAEVMITSIEIPLETTRASIPDSGSYSPGISVGIALASVGTLLLVSF